VVAAGSEAHARAALQRYGIDVDRLTLIADDWNTTFRVDTRSGDRYAVRVYLPDRRSDDEIRTEVAWLESLSARGAVRVPLPLRAIDGAPFVRAGTGDASRRVAVFSWVPGERLADDPGPDLVSAFGEAVARLHEHGRSFATHEGLRTWDRPFPHGGGAVFDDAGADVIDREARSAFERAFDAASEAVARLARSGEPPRIVHGDLHPDNVFVAGDHLWFIDFDDCALAWPVQDLGVLMWEVGEDEMPWAYRDAFRQGYETVAPWPERWRGEIDTFAACRGLIKADDSVRARVEPDLASHVRRRADAIAGFLGRTR
jgi:Ser/Thr protein kinase RdoA (MazF antagonist)